MFVAACLSFELVGCVFTCTVFFIDECVVSAVVFISLPRGELYVMSHQQLKRFDGSFSAYKTLIKKKVASGEPVTV